MGNDKLHKRAFSMEKRMEKLSRTEKPREQKKLSVRFKERDFSGDEVAAADGLCKRFGDRTLFSDLSFIIEGQERIAVIGDNGSGKSTLVNLITGELAPDAGWIGLGPSVRWACLPQLVRFQDDSRTAYVTMLWECRCEPQDARDRLAAFGFRGEDVFKPVAALSGGERSRLKLCMLMGGEINFLILDEPTNHLDIVSREWMEDALSDYGETLLFVSHDRFFIEKFATRIWAFEDGRLTDYRGGYREYVEWKHRQDALAAAEKRASSAAQQSSSDSRNGAQGAASAKRSGRPENVAKGASPAKRLQRIEKEIEKLEQKLASLEEEAALHASDYLRLMELEEEKAPLNQRLLEYYQEWEALSDG